MASVLTARRAGTSWYLGKKLKRSAAEPVKSTKTAVIAMNAITARMIRIVRSINYTKKINTRSTKLQMYLSMENIWKCDKVWLKSCTLQI